MTKHIYDHPVSPEVPLVVRSGDIVSVDGKMYFITYRFDEFHRIVAVELDTGIPYCNARAEWDGVVFSASAKKLFPGGKVKVYKTVKHIFIE